MNMIDRYGSAAQKEELLEGMFTGEQRVAFGLTEPDHGRTPPGWRRAR